MQNQMGITYVQAQPSQNTQNTQNMQNAQDWSREISFSQNAPEMIPGLPMNTMPGMMQGVVSSPGTLQFSTGLTAAGMETPSNAEEVYRGSLRGLLAQNVGHYIVATFLIGTQSPVSWEGFLHSVGNDYLVIFQPDLGRYITGDFYALKFVEFHDQKGVVPPCAGYRRLDAGRVW